MIKFILIKLIDNFLFLCYYSHIKLNAFVFDQFQNGYYKIGEKVGQAWQSGNKFM